MIEEKYDPLRGLDFDEEDDFGLVCFQKKKPTAEKPVKKRRLKEGEYARYRKYPVTVRMTQEEKARMRVELTFVGATKIMRDFGTNLFSDFSDDLITRVYKNTIERYVSKTLAQAQKKRCSKLLTILKSEHKKGDNGWITKSLRRIMNAEIEEAVPFLLDIHEVFPFIESFLDAKGAPLSASRKYKIREGFLSHASAYEKAFCKGDHDKLVEILAKIG